MIQLAQKLGYHCSRCGCWRNSAVAIERAIEIDIFGAVGLCARCNATSDEWDVPSAEITAGERKIRRLCISVGLDVGERVVLRRLRPGYHERSAGAWSWVAESIDGRDVVASCYPLQKLVVGRVALLHRPSGRSQWTPELVPE